MKLYQQLLLQSWETTMRHPSRWVFGLFSALLVGNGGEIDRYLRYTDALGQKQGWMNVVFWSQQSWFQGLKYFVSSVHAYVLFSVVIIAFIFLLYVVTVAQGSLIASTSVSTKQSTTFANLFNLGQRHALPLFMLNICSYIVLVLVLLVCSQLPFIAATVVLLPSVLCISWITKYAANVIVIHNVHLGKAIRSGLTMLAHQFIPTLVMSLVVFGVAIIINLLIVISISIMVAPFYSSIVNQLYTVNTIGIIIYTVAMIGFGAILSTWQWTTWTLLFKQFSHKAYPYRSHSSGVRAQPL